MMMRNSRSRLTVAVAAVAGLSTSALAQNLLSNPSFETGDFTGWTKTGSGTVRAAGPTMAARTGVFALDTAFVSGSGSGLTLTQTVPVTGGSLYELGLWKAINRTSPTAGVSATSGGMTIGLSTATSSIATALLARTPTRYQRIRTLVWIPAGQSSATVKFQTSGSGNISDTVFSDDDYYMTLWTPTATAAPAEEVFVPNSPLVGGGKINDTSALALANDGRIAAMVRDVTFNNIAVVRQSDGRYVVPGAMPAGVTLSWVSLSPTGQTTLLRGFVPSGTVPQVIGTIGPGGGFVEAARVGQALPTGGTLSGIDDVSTDDAGRVVFIGRAGSPSVPGIYRSSGGTGGITAVAVPGMVNAQGTVTFVGPFGQNNTGQIVFGAGITPPGASSSKDYVYVNDGSTSVVRVAAGDPAPGTGGGTFSSVASMAINDSGVIAFTGRLSAVAPFVPGIWTNDGAANQLVALTGQAAPGGGTYTKLGNPIIGNGGHVAFAAQTSDGSGLFLAPPGGAGPVAIARAGDALPGGGAFEAYNSFSLTIEAKVLSGGQVVFASRDESNRDEMGIYLSDGKETLNIASWGQTIDGNAITQLQITVPPPFSVFTQAQPRVNANDFGQVAYSARFAQGGLKNYLYTPTLHWRSADSGDWSDTDNWTVGLTPAAVHPVIIDSPNEVNVTTPAGQTKIKSLEVGAGNKLTLTAGSDLIVSDRVTIAGTLAGSGTITGDVDNAGVISPGNSAGTITIDGDLTQTGRLALELLEDGFDSIIVHGNATLGGDVFVTGGGDLGETFALFTADHLIDNATWHLPGESTMQIVTLPGGGQSVQVTYVPEPAGMVAGLIALSAMGRRRRGRR